MDESEKLLAILNELNLSVATAESCTGGNIAHHITLVPGASSVMLGGIVSYSNEIKAKLLDVKQSDLDKYGAVSKAVVEQMARGVCKTTGADMGIATSGIAGPGGGTAEKPVGTVWIAVFLSPRDQTVATVERFSGNRAEVINQATRAALKLAISILRGESETNY